MMSNKFTDQLGNQVILNKPPERIVSLVPSQTELLYDLGLDEKVIGITKFCVHPASWRKSKTIVGGTKRIRHDVMDELQPDLIIANKEENTKEDIELLQKKYPVWISDVISWQDALQMIKGIAEVTGKVQRAEELLKQIENAFADLPALPSAKVLYLIWRGPWMAAAADTFIDIMLNKIGWQNVLKDYSRYPELTTEQIQSLKPDYILLSSEPYPFKEAHIKELKLICPQAQVLLVDGEMFSWYGSRLLQVPVYIKSLQLS
ncbi:MAG TPA: helical backbone metal receptor [Cyclobacteriaceae bacterium]|nr:helical backbone metal receptor [Cyclobacteriaceae bacterium]